MTGALSEHLFQMHENNESIQTKLETREQTRFPSVLFNENSRTESIFTYFFIHFLGAVE